jgi:hypothetical protein
MSAITQEVSTFQVVVPRDQRRDLIGERLVIDHPDERVAESHWGSFRPPKTWVMWERDDRDRIGRMLGLARAARRSRAGRTPAMAS